MKFNVHKWDGKQWFYLCTCKASNEREAVEMAASRFGLQERYSAYPHVDNFEEVA